MTHARYLLLDLDLIKLNFGDYLVITTDHRLVKLAVSSHIQTPAHRTHILSFASRCTEFLNATLFCCREIPEQQDRRTRFTL